ncbi:MAG: DUF2277 domain-containing protein [Deltaproteobacteria bacterium]|nr:MAG: DUF2277 domain-containing protein [Deltaproteobacteria bacterium]
MCRNIKLLFNFEPPATEAEIRASALQYVRKVSGLQKPSAANQAACDRAVAEIAAITRRLLLDELETRATPRDRAVERERAKARGQDREVRLRARIAAESRPKAPSPS